jgi:hypothetical protein
MLDTTRRPTERRAARVRVLRLLRRIDRRPTSGVTSRYVVGWAVRRDWSGGGGTHEFVGFRTDRGAAARQLGRDREFWRGAVKPRLSLVGISHSDYRLHFRRHMCSAPDCPVSDVEGVAASVVGGLW